MVAKSLLQAGKILVEHQSFTSHVYSVCARVHESILLKFADGFEQSDSVDLGLRPAGGPVCRKLGCMVPRLALEYEGTWWDHICGHLVRSNGA